MTFDPDRRTGVDRRLEKQIELAEAEASKPLRNLRAKSPAEAKREMDAARAEIEATITAMQDKVTGEVDDVKRTIDIPNRLRDRVRSDPWRSLAVAAGVGLGLALLTAGKKRGYDTLTKDEIEEIRAWRSERRRHLDRLETIMERAAKKQVQPTLRERIRARLADGRREK
ncbi:MAG TPA: hypothetical protein VF039_01625 [Longimicrobiales bacterium]